MNNPQPQPKDDAALQPPWTDDPRAAIRHRLGADPPLLTQSVEELAGNILERHGISADLPDAVVAAYGWAACQHELGLLVTQRLQEIQDLAVDESLSYAEAMFKVANSARFKGTDTRISKLRREIKDWEDALVLTGQ